MARIKYVLNERRIAYEEALELHETHRAEVIDRAAEPVRRRARKMEKLKIQLELLEAQVAEVEGAAARAGPLSKGPTFEAAMARA